MILEPVIILANGNYPKHSVPIEKINQAGSIICCDGALDSMIENGKEPYVIIGDLDSIDSNLKAKYKDRIIHFPDQNENDLRKAIRWAEDKGIKEVAILGSTGKREDHSLANIFILLQFPTSLNCTLITDHGVFTVVEGTTEFTSFTGQQVSLFSPDPEIEITSTNLKYNIISTKLYNLYIGSLNESRYDNFTINISHGKILVYQVFA